MRVLIAVDESQYCQSIVDFILAHNWMSGTEFMVLSVVESLKIGSLMAALPGPILDDLVESHRKSGQQLVSDVASKLSQALAAARVETMITEGDPAAQILQLSKQWNAQLIVVGSHGRQGLNKLVMGSVSQAVVAHAPCSVVVVRQPVGS